MLTKRGVAFMYAYIYFTLTKYLLTVFPLASTYVWTCPLTSVMAKRCGHYIACPFGSIRAVLKYLEYKVLLVTPLPPQQAHGLFIVNRLRG